MFASRTAPEDHFQRVSRRDWLMSAALACGGMNLVRAGVQAQDPPAGYVRPFGPQAPWNLPVADLPAHADGVRIVERLFRDAGGDRNQSFAITTDTYTAAVYDARTANGPTAIKTFWPSNLVGKVPWNPLWKPSAGSEGRLIVLDSDLGMEWDVSKPVYRNQQVRADSANLVTGDYRTREDGFFASRGSGLPYLAMLVRPQEVAQGKIEHALSMTIPNISLKEFVAPATKAEFTRGLRLGVPVGTRFSLKYSDEELDRWQAKLPMKISDRARETARMIAVALRDYGWFVTEISPGNLLQFESSVTAEKPWAKLGFEPVKVAREEYPRDLVSSLFHPDRVVAYAPSDEYPEALRAKPTSVD